MPNVTGDQLTFNIDSISDNQILVYDGDNGIFVAQDSLAANSNVGIANASNVGSSGVGVFKEKDGEHKSLQKQVLWLLPSVKYGISFVVHIIIDQPLKGLKLSRVFLELVRAKIQ